MTQPPTDPEKVQVLETAPSDPGAKGLVPASDVDLKEGVAIHRDRTTHRVFSAIVDVVLIALLMFFYTAKDPKEFATVVMGPLLTILAGAAGFYFGRRDS